MVGPVLLVAVPVGGYGGAALVLAAVLGAAGPFPATLSSRARTFVDGPWGARTVQAPSVVVARLVLVVFAALSALGALVGLLGGFLALASATVAASSVRSSGGELGDAFGGAIGVFGGAVGLAMIVSGLICGGMAALGFWLRGALGARHRGARIATTVIAGLVSFFMLLGLLGGGVRGPGTLLLGLDLALVVLLWVPSDARQHFGDVPLPLVEHVRAQVVRALAPGGAPTAAGPLGGPAPAGRPSPAAGGLRAPAGPATAAGLSGRIGGPAPDPSAVTVGLSTEALVARATAAPAGTPTRTPAGPRTGPPSGRHIRPELACPRCGVAAVPGGAFCGHCGGPLTVV